MCLMLLRGLRAIVIAGFVLCAAAFVGLSIYATLQLGLWWPALMGIEGSTRLVLAAVTLLPFLLLFTKLNWSRPLCWLAERFNRAVAPIDRAIAAKEQP